MSEALSRAELLALKAAGAQRYAWKVAIYEELFGRQRRLYNDPARAVAAHPGRRSGKSEFIPRAALLDVLGAGFGETVMIGAETQKKAKELHWHHVARLVRQHKLPLKPNRQDGTWSTPWGATLVFWGCADHGAVELIRGFKLKAAYFDEVATYAPLLAYLTKTVVQPALQDTDGKLYLLGTPSVTRAGAWFEICEGRTPGWSVHHWTVLDNPRFPRDARAMLLAVLAANQWTEENATYQREWMGRFVNDTEAQVYKYLASRNDLAAMPALYAERAREWLHVMGVDFGTTAPCAWVVWAFHPHARAIYAVHAEKHAGLLVDGAALITARLCERFDPVALVGDVGGLGKPYAAEWNARYAGRVVRDAQLVLPLPGEKGLLGMKAADKAGKHGHIKLLNNELGAARAHVLPAAKPYADELAALPYLDPSAPEQSLKEHPAYANHCCDAGLYGYIETRTYLNEAPAPALADRHPDDQAAWLEQQEAERLRAERERPDWERF